MTRDRESRKALIRFAAALAVLILLIGAALFFWLDREDGNGIDGPASAEQSTEEATGSRRRGEARSPSRVMSPDAASRAQADAELFPDSWLQHVDDRGGPILRILTPDGSRGVAGATVAFLPYEGEAKLAIDSQSTMGERFLLHSKDHGFILKTDQRGYCSLPRFHHKGQILATSNLGFLPPQQIVYHQDISKVIEYELMPAREYALRILDHRGEPAPGLEVRLQTMGDDKSGFFRDRQDARTDSKGVAWFFQPRIGKAEKARFMPILPAAGLIPIPAEPLEAGDEIPTLRLHQLGSLELTILTPRGEPFRGRVKIRQSRPDPIDLPLFDWDPANRAALDLIRQGPVVTLNHVAIGQDSWVRVEAVDRSYDYADHLVQGPTLDDLTAKAELQLGEARHSLGMTFLNEAGQLGADLVVSLRALRPGDPVTVYDFGVHRTDARGRVRVGVRPAALCAPNTKLEALVISRSRLERPDDSPADLPWHELGAIVALPLAEAYPEHFDLGRIELRRPPVLVQGRIVDDRGRPVVDATVRAVIGEPKRRSQVGNTAARTDLQGRFCLASHRYSGPCRLLLEKPGWPSFLTTSFPALTRDVEVSFPRGGRIALTFAQPIPDFRSVDIRLHGLPASPDPLDPEYLPRRRGTWVNARRVVWSGLRPGTASIRMKGWVDAQGTAFEIGELLVEGGRQTLDSRLENVSVSKTP